MTREELSLLLYLETRAVDHAGIVDMSKVNGQDHEIIDRWVVEKFIDFGRICYEDIVEVRRFSRPTSWCRLSPEAWEKAHAERRVRAERMWDSKRFRTTAEKRASE
jgi:hypothetical protein